MFTEDRSKVAATVHVPYMNSIACWGKRREKKKKKKKGKRRNLKHSKRGSKIVPYMKSQSLVLLKLINNDNLSHPCQRVTWKGRESKRPIDTKGMFG